LLDQIDLKLLLKWTILCLITGVCIGSIGAFFLTSLNFVTALRIQNAYLIYGLPIVGGIIGYGYYKFGGSASKGNHLLLESISDTKVRIPLRMSGMILLSTLLTHLVGGSAGREGTAVQIGGSIAAQWNRWKKFTIIEQQWLIYLGIAGGFSAVFGTPLAATVFAVELVKHKKQNYSALLPCLLTAYVSYFTCIAWNVHHTQYVLHETHSFQIKDFMWTAIAGCLFGGASYLFCSFNKFWRYFFEKIPYPPARPILGGTLLLLVLLLTSKQSLIYLGLGIPTIQAAFLTAQSPETFFLKIVFTTFTLSAGFKGGEVTPLFFIGATLGNVLVCFLPLPSALLAGIGFVAVFAGASKTPIACTLMGMELFGLKYGVHLGIGCTLAYLCSGKLGIYTNEIRTK